VTARLDENVAVCVNGNKKLLDKTERLDEYIAVLAENSSIGYI
jgi:hypothetical protein